MFTFNASILGTSLTPSIGARMFSVVGFRDLPYSRIPEIWNSSRHFFPAAGLQVTQYLVRELSSVKGINAIGGSSTSRTSSCWCLEREHRRFGGDLHQRLILISKAPKIPSHLVLISNSLQRGTSFVVNSDQHHTFPRESARNFGRRGNFDVGNSRVVQHVLQDSITR